MLLNIQHHYGSIIHDICTIFYVQKYGVGLWGGGFAISAEKKQLILFKKYAVTKNVSET